MKVKNTIRIFGANFKVVYKDMLFRLAATAVLIAIAAIFVTPLIKDIAENTATREMLDSLRNLIGSFFGGGKLAESTVAWNNAKISFSSMLIGYMNQIVGVCVGLVIIIIFHAAFFGMANYASCVSISDRMSSLSKTGYIRSMFKGFGKGFVCQAISAAINFVAAIAAILLADLFIVYTVEYLTVFSFILGILFVCTVMAVINGLLAGFMPSVACGNGITRGFRESAKMFAKNYGTLIMQFLVLEFLAIWFNVSVAFFTLGAGVVFSVPATYVFFICVKLSVYYDGAGKKYYIDSRHIVNPKEDDEEFANVDFD